jgi:hypothetical protein
VMPADNLIPGTKKSNEYPRTFLFAGILAAIICTLAPVLSTTTLPYVDYPIHLSMFGTIHDLKDVDSSPDNPFAFRMLTPYSGTFWLAGLVMKFLPIETSGKAVLAIYFILTPLFFMGLLKACHQPLIYGFFIFPLLFNFNLSWGFIPFLLAVPVLFCVLALSVKLSLQEGKALPYILAGTLLLLFFVHLFVFIIGAVLAGTIRCIGKGSLKRKLIQVTGIFLPSGLMGGIWYSGLRFSDADQIFLSKKLIIPSLWVKLKYFPDYAISGDPFWGYRAVFWIILGAMALIIWVNRSQYGSLSKMIDNPHTRIRWTISITVLVLYFVCPYSLLTAVWLYNRLAFLVLAAIILVLPDQLHFRRSVFVSICVLLIAAMSGYTTWIYSRFESEANPGLACLSKIEPGKNLTGLILNARSQYTDHSVYDHIDQYYQIRYDGIVHNPFAVLTHMPVQYREPWMSREANLQFETYTRRGITITDSQFEQNDYFLVRLSNRGSNPIPELFGDHLFDIRPVVQEHPWIVFQKDLPEVAGTR